MFCPNLRLINKSVLIFCKLILNFGLKTKIIRIEGQKEGFAQVRKADFELAVEHTEKLGSRASVVA